MSSRSEGEKCTANYDFYDSEVIKNQKHAKLINQQKSSTIQITLWAS